ncbi:MAG: endonuclease MutS2, partial [Candidatus Sericytochromatia bacterium]
GAILQGTTFLDISSTLRAIRVLKKFLTTKLKEENELYKMVFPLYTNETLEREIEISFSSDGSVNDIASKELAKIRGNIRQIQQNLRDRLNKLMQDSKYKGALQENYITQRNGRYVIPVKAESQSSIKGIVLDQSQSGSTVYLEPLAIVDENNKLAKKLLEEKNEIEKILLEFGYKVLPDISLLLDAVNQMTEVDAIIAKANYAISIDGHKPILNNYGFINLNRIKHPVLIAQKGLENVVPINISLGKDFDTMIITGSNTGGKTVTLKTLGLSSIMAKSGMFLSAGLDCEVAFFDKVLADIGDEQSLEQNLSTFSGHLTNINKIMQNADKNSLVLLDEAGTGTDATEGT